MSSSKARFHQGLFIAYVYTTVCPQNAVHETSAHERNRSWRVKTFKKRKALRSLVSHALTIAWVIVVEKVGLKALSTMLSQSQRSTSFKVVLTFTKGVVGTIQLNSASIKRTVYVAISYGTRLGNMWVTGDGNYFEMNQNGGKPEKPCQQDIVKLCGGHREK